MLENVDFMQKIKRTDEEEEGSRRRVDLPMWMVEIGGFVFGWGIYFSNNSLHSEWILIVASVVSYTGIEMKSRRYPLVVCGRLFLYRILTNVPSRNNQIKNRI